MSGRTPTSASRFRELVVVGVLIAVGVLNIVPGVALVAPGRLSALYGTDGLSTDLLVLLRHRALLLAMLGGSLVLAAARPGWRRPALVAGLLSNVVFVLLALTVPTSAEISRVAVIDLVALPFLIVGLVLGARGTARSAGPIRQLQATRTTGEPG